MIASLVLVFAPYSASAQARPVETPSHIECLERMELPDYPLLPRQAHVEATQTVKVLLSEQATVQSIDHSFQGRAVDLGRLFNAGAEKALRNSRFSKSCGGKTITLVFHYEFREDESKSIFAFGPPNQFWIRAELAYVNPEASVK